MRRYSIRVSAVAAAVWLLLGAGFTLALEAPAPRLANPQAASPDKGLFQRTLPSGKTHYMAFVPEGTEAKTDVPLVVALHGSGGTAKNFMRLWTGLAKQKGFWVLALKSPNPQGWSLEDFTLLTEMLDDFARTHRYARDRTFLTGFSAGGHSTVVWGIKGYKRFAAAAAVSGCLVTQQGLPFPEAKSLPMYLLVGEQDPNFPGVKRTKQQLEDKGFSIKLDTFPGLKHQYPKDASQRIWKFFSAYAAVSTAHRALAALAEALDAGALGRARPLIAVAKAALEEQPGEAGAKTQLLALKPKLAALTERFDTAWRKLLAENPAEQAAFDAFTRAERDVTATATASKRKRAATALRAVLSKHAGTQAAAMAERSLKRMLTDPVNGTALADALDGPKARRLWRKAESYTRRKRPADAARIHKELIAKYPFTSYAAKARAALAH